MAVVAAAPLLAAPLPLPPAEASPAESLVRRLEARQAQSGDLTARFVQTYRSGVLGREMVERGVMSIKRPGRMRWDYKDPEKKTFVADGRNFYFYVPADRQVVVREEDRERSIPALLLSGKGDILGQFQVGLEAAPPGRQRLRLTPRKPEPEIERALVDVDETGRVRSIEVEDAQGSLSRFEFDDIRDNLNLPDRLFRFQVPAGVEVITG